MIYGFSYDFLWVFLCFHTFFHAFPSKKHLKKNRPPATPRQPLAEGRLGGRYGFIIYTRFPLPSGYDKHSHGKSPFFIGKPL